MGRVRWCLRWGARGSGAALLFGGAHEAARRARGHEPEVYATRRGQPVPNAQPLALAVPDDPAWYSNALGTAVSSVSVSPIAHAGASGAGLWRVDLKYKTPSTGLPRRIVAKWYCGERMQVPGLIERIATWAFGVNHDKMQIKEVCVYESAEPSLPAPHIYYTQRDQRGSVLGMFHALVPSLWPYCARTLVLMEDLGVGHTASSSWEPLTPPMACAAAEALAALHATTWRMVSKPPAEAPMWYGLLYTNNGFWARLFCSWTATPEEVDRTVALQPAVLAHCYPPEVQASMRGLAAGRKEFMAAFDAMCEQPRAVARLHGDSHCMNLFATTGEGPPKVKFIDWQLSANFFAVADVAYLLQTSVEPDPATEAAVLSAYHGALARHGLKDLPSIADMRRECELFYCVALLKTLGASWLDRRSPEDRDAAFQATPESRNLMTALAATTPRLLRRVQRVVEHDTLGLGFQPLPPAAA